MARAQHNSRTETTRDVPLKALEPPPLDETLYFRDEAVPYVADDLWVQEEEVELEKPPEYPRARRALDPDTYEEMQWQKANVPPLELPRKGDTQRSPAAPEPAPASGPKAPGWGRGGRQRLPDDTDTDEGKRGSGSKAGYGFGSYGGGGYGEGQASRGWFATVCIAALAVVFIVLQKL